MQIPLRRITLSFCICFYFFFLFHHIVPVRAQITKSYIHQQQVDQSFREQQFDLQTRQRLRIRQTEPVTINRLQALQREHGLRQRELFQQQRRRVVTSADGPAATERQRFEQERAEQALDFELQRHSRILPSTDTE